MLIRKISPFLMLLALASCGQNNAETEDNNGFFPNPNNGTVNNELNNSNNMATNNGASPTNNSTNTQTNNSTSSANNFTVPDTDEVDILWIIDNSGSMCEEQHILQENFRFFADEMAKANTDFHLAISTTQMELDYRPEPLARPGRIQSTPQPIPGFSPECIQAFDDEGNRIENDYTPLRRAQEIALSCATDPNPNLSTISDADIKCLVSGNRDCVIAGVCGQGAAGCQVSDLFPDPTQYRALPKVMRAQDYQKDGSLDTDRLLQDFNCASLVGTRGYGIEQGLASAIEAIKPTNTGGSVESPVDSSAPNHGFLRENSKFGLIFLTDENDCSHPNGSIELFSSCGDAVCEYANIAGDEQNSPLFQLGEMKAQLIANLSASKGRMFSSQEIRIASMNGSPQRFSGQVRQSCPDVETGVTPSCNGLNGVAYSGDRYLGFLEQFDSDKIFPKANDPIQGWICEDSYQNALTEIGELFAY